MKLTITYEIESGEKKITRKASFEVAQKDGERITDTAIEDLWKVVKCSKVEKNWE